MINKDHFSDRAALYAVFRPTYPDSLFDILARLPARRSLALDCGTGNGQAAIGLATRFDYVVATDGSAGQLEHAVSAPNLTYRQSPAEASGLPEKSVDLVTAAQALHWFDIPAFFAEAQRVLVSGGCIAVWGYGDPTVDDPGVQSVVHGFNRGTLEDYWLPERSLLLAGYRTIEFPFEEIVTPSFCLEQHWSLHQLTGLMRTWSATARFAAAHGRDPVADVEGRLARAWGDPDKARLIRWPLYLRAGRARS
ncbi:MAG TPA: class I SAM-dependent methyltransferase [Gemmatimonadaceae bacterium]|nr:class I SAM-dependent methyltransferase [Gemmatimonadaceae bacterium]